MNIVGSGKQPEPAVIIDALARLTGGWTLIAGSAPETLAAARRALAATIAAGHNPGELHPGDLSEWPAPLDHKLHTELLDIVSGISGTAPPNGAAIVRSALSAEVTNPSGVPPWARGAAVSDRLGPFRDRSGILHWVDVILFTVATPFAFGNASNPFAVFPIVGPLIPTPVASDFTLGRGSAWFLAEWLSSVFPAGAFTGFSVTGGSLTVSMPASNVSGAYVVPAGATLTLTATLAADSTPTSSGEPGADAAASVFIPPSTIAVVFRESNAVIQAIADSRAQAYGTSVELRWNHAAPVPLTEFSQLIIPCDPSRVTFDFATVESDLFTPAGAAVIAQSGWALPLVTASATTLPEASGPGSGLLELKTGASITAELQPGPVPVTDWRLEIGTGSLWVIARGKAAPTTTSYRLWQGVPPAQLPATVDITTGPEFACSFLSSPTEELLVTAGQADAHVDRPLTASGQRVDYQSGAIVLLRRTQASDVLALIGGPGSAQQVFSPVALENALLGVDAPGRLTLEGTVSGTNMLDCRLAISFNVRWLLPTLPDPYAATFDTSSVIEGSSNGSAGTLLAMTTWAGPPTEPELAFTLSPPPSAAFPVRSNSDNPDALASFIPPSAFAFSARLAAAQRSEFRLPLALLDLSTSVDLFGVAVVGRDDRLSADGQNATRIDRTQDNSSSPSGPTPDVAVSGMALVLNGGLVATFALPQVSWEPMESTASPAGPVVCDPPSDGWPLLVSAPNSQQLVPFNPFAVLQNNVDNVAAGTSFSAMFSLPFGLNAFIDQPNRRLPRPRNGSHSLFLLEGGQFGTKVPSFPDFFPPAPPRAAPPDLKPPADAGRLDGALQLKVVPPFPENEDAAFSGYTVVDTSGETGPSTGYGYTVLGQSPGGQPVVGVIFENAFGPSGATPGVPLRRIDFSGYGASIFSDWIKSDVIPPGIIKVQFVTTIGRTAYEVIQATSIIYPYCVRAVRTITMQRRNAGWVQRTDTGWQPASSGLFKFPPDTAAEWLPRVHPGALEGVFNVRNIRETPDTFDAADSTSSFKFQKVLFDADLGIDPSVNVQAGGFTARVDGQDRTLVTAKGMIGYMQMAPDGHSPTPTALQNLLQQTGPLDPVIACNVEVGSFGGVQGTVLRCSAFEINMIDDSKDGNATPALGVALRGAPQIPRGGGWSLGRRKYTEPEPAALPDDFPVPLVQPRTIPGTWFLADVTDVLRLSQPDSFYGLLHSTGTQKILFEQPQIPTGPSANPVPGLQFPKPNPAGSARPGAVTNPGSPNLGDLAALLNSTGLFPDIGSTLSLLQGTVEQIDSISQGFRYSKSYTFDQPVPQVTLIDLPILSVVMRYSGGDWPDPTDSPVPPLQQAAITYTVDSSSSPSWTLSIGPLSFLVIIPQFGSDPVLTVTGEFYADEHTAAGLTKLNVQLGAALSVVKQVFSKLQMLAQYLPGGAGANLDVGVSNGKVTVRDSFTIADLPLGVGDLTDVSLNLGLAVQLQPLLVDFSVGLGEPDHPFNWIVSPLAGNGLIALGIQESKPAASIQAGLGLGLAIDLGIAAGSASVAIAVQLDVQGSAVTLMAILSGQASVDVLDGLATVGITLSAAMGIQLDPVPPPVSLQPPFSVSPPQIPTSVTIGSEQVTLLAACSVGIHLTVCWLASVNWDGSWHFSQSVNTPELTVSI